MSWKHAAVAALLVLGSACGDRDRDRRVAARPDTAAADTGSYADPLPGEDIGLTREEVERGRLDTEWTAVVTLDTTGSGDPVRNLERWEQISTREVNTGPAVLPLGGDVAGPSVLRVQILLDRALFSPGMMDGRWGKNTAKAVYFFQQREGLRTTGRVDSATFQRLSRVAGAPRQLVRPYRLTAADVEGPFVELPDSIYDRARLDCSCYESLGEKLAERFHVEPEVLEKLNPGVRLDYLRPGQTLQVPSVRDSTAAVSGPIARLVVSGRGSFVHALDASGRIVVHFPSTLGATYDPSPSGRFRVTRVTRDPWWHYQPTLLARVPDHRPEARIPPGPNNRVGVVWMALSVPHYGIHGTDNPEAIGYTSSAGCVRLTNWDAAFLARHIRPGTPVAFRDIRGRGGSGGPRTEVPAASAAGRGTRGAAGEDRDRGRRGGSARPDTAGGRSRRDTAADTTR